MSNINDMEDLLMSLNTIVIRKHNVYDMESLLLALNEER